MPNKCRIAVYVIATLLPLLSLGAPLCSKLFQRPIVHQESLPQELRELLAELSDPAYPADFYYQELGTLVQKRLNDLGVKYKNISELGEYSFRILKDSSTDLGRLAKSIRKRYGADLIVSAELFIEYPTEAMVYDARKTKPKSTPQFFLGIPELFRLKRAMRSPVFLHELRHLHQTNLIIQSRPSLYSIELVAKQGLLPGFHGELKKSSYAKKFNVDEIKAFHSELRAHLINLKNEITSNSPERLSELLFYVQETRARLAAITQSTDTSLGVLRRAIKENPHQIEAGYVKKRFFAGMSEIPWGNSLLTFSLHLPSVTKKNYDITLVSKRMLEQIAQTRALTRELRTRLIKVNALLKQLENEGPPLTESEKKDILTEAIGSLPLLPH